MFRGNRVVLGKLSLREDVGAETEDALGGDSRGDGNGWGGVAAGSGIAGGTEVGTGVGTTGDEVYSLGEDMGGVVGFGTGD